MSKRRATAAKDAISTIKHPAVLGARQSLGQVGGQPPVSYLVEGHKIALQALESPAQVESIFLRAPGKSVEDVALRNRAVELGVPCHVASRGVFVRVHDLGYETSVSALAVVRRAMVDDLPCAVSRIDCLLIGERIQDPRNIGSLIRTADACGVTAVAFTDDSADPFSRGSVRPSTGSILRVPLVRVSRLPDWLARLRGQGIRMIATSAHAPTQSWEADLTEPCAILLGNESVGLSDEARRACDAFVSIPMSGGAHSFNVAVAAGIMLYERKRQLAAGA